MKSPFFSIITVTLNNGSELERSLRSVAKQTDQDIEYIVIDGGSNDDTRQIVERYNAHISFFKSEPDDGTYDAMNKGLIYASGELVYFLNSGDELATIDSLQRVREIYAKKQKPDILYCNVCCRHEDGSEYLIIYRPGLSHRFLFRHTVCHQAVFAKRVLFEATGPFDLRYPIVADYDWLMRCRYFHKARFAHIDETLSIYYLGGISSTTNIMPDRYNVINRVMPLPLRMSIVATEPLSKFSTRVVRKLRRVLYP